MPETRDDADNPVFQARRARCHACQTIWTAHPEPQQPSPEPLASVEPVGQITPDSDASAEDFPDDDADSAQGQNPRRHTAIRLLAILLLALLLLGAGFALGQLSAGAPLRTTLTDSWTRLSALRLELPVQSLRLALPRAPVPPLAVEIAPPKSQRIAHNLVWEISGRIHNRTNQPQPVPPVEILLLDASDRVLSRSTLSPAAVQLAPGQGVDFHGSTIDPPARAVRVRARLKPAELGRL